jgi:hypothetical protein
MTSGQPPRPRRSPVGTQRRLRALAARSWSPEAIERETGIPSELISLALGRADDITPDLVGAVAAAYDRLWDREPPAATRDDQQAAAMAALRAARRGWAPPLAWDDDQIDLPGARPEPGWKPRQRITRRAVDLVEDATFLRQRGGYQDTTMSEIAMRLGVSRNRLDQAYVRARRYGARTATPETQAEAEAG